MPSVAASLGWRLTACLLALLLVAGCVPAANVPLPSASVVPEATPDPEVVVAGSPLPTVGLAADVAASPLPTARAGREPLRLVVLHSNDNWGETEPCG